MFVSTLQLWPLWHGGQALGALTSSPEHDDAQVLNFATMQQMVPLGQDGHGLLDCVSDSENKRFASNMIK